MCGILFQCSRTSPINPNNKHIALLRSRGPDAFQSLQCCAGNRSSERAVLEHSHPFHLFLAASVLSFRGDKVCQQPLQDDELGAIFAWNGEAWSYNSDPVHGNDTLFILRQIQILASSAATKSPRNQLVGLAIYQILSKVHGPFAFALYDGASSCLCMSNP